MRNRCAAGAWIILILCAGCSSGGGSNSGSSGGPDPSSFAGDALQGTNVCGSASSTLTKKVSITVDQLPSDIEVGRAWIAHSSEDYLSYIYGAFEVTNTGTVGHCFVEAHGLTYLNASGAEVGYEEFNFIYGEVNALTSVTTGTCLGPGKSAYFNLIDPLSYLDIASLHLDSIDYQEGGAVPQAKLTATSYSTTATGAEIVIDNQGTGIANAASVVAYALDSANEFLIWDFPALSSTAPWGPGEQRTASTSMSYDAPCPNLRVVIDFEAAELSSSSAAAQVALPLPSVVETSVSARAEALLRQRQEIERTKAERMESLN